jgi:uncharacterized protein (DUF433 family)
MTIISGQICPGLHCRGQTCIGISMATDTTYRYLVRLPGVRSGNMIVEGTRIGVHDVVGLIVNGAGIDDVVRSFPDLTRAQVYECLAYYEDHREEIDWLIAEQMAEAPE